MVKSLFALIVTLGFLAQTALAEPPKERSDWDKFLDFASDAWFPMMATGAGVAATGQVLEKPSVQKWLVDTFERLKGGEQKPPVSIEVDGIRMTMDDLLSGKAKLPYRWVKMKMDSQELANAVSEHLAQVRPNIVGRVAIKRVAGPTKAAGVTLVIGGLGMMGLVGESDDPRLTGRTSKDVLFKPSGTPDAPTRPTAGNPQ